MSVNKIILIGNVGQTPEIKQTANSTLAKFSLATSEKYKNNSGEWVENTEWHNCQAWGKLAEIIEKHVGKGDQLYLEGKMKTTSYDKEGQKVYRTDVEIRDMKFLGKKS